MPNDPVVLVDVMNLVFRSHFAFSGLSSEGKPTGVIYGILKSIADLRDNVSKRIVFVWDHGIPVLGAEKPRNWRDEMMKGYKGTRKQDPEVRKLVFPQLLSCSQLIKALGYSNESIMGLEADDLIGLLAANTKDDVLIYSTDQDFYQLLNSKVRILVPKKDKGVFRIVTAADVEAGGVAPSRWAEYLALGGDKSDNIKPMRGMGPKTAIKLIQSGVDLNKGYSRQPLAFIAKYGSVWEKIQECYSAAKVPTSWTDPRIQNCTKGKPIALKPDQQKSTPQDVKFFTQFCSDRELVTILSIRHRLFNSGEQQWPTTTVVTKQPPSQRWQKGTLGLSRLV